MAERWSRGTLMPALGVLYLAAVLEQHGTEVEVVPGHVLGLSWREIYRKIESDRPDVVGITTTTENRFLSFRLAKVAKAAHPATFVVLGGPHCRGTAEDTLAHLPEVDGVVSGEGERTMLELVKALEARGDLRSIAGLTFRRGEEVVSNPSRQKFVDLNALPLPARHLVPWEKYHFQLEVPGQGLQPAANLMTSRGCPFNCAFCATPGNWGRRVRGRTPAKVVAEIEHLREHYGAQALWFCDDTFNYHPQRTEAICDLLLERKLDVHWYCEVALPGLTKRLLAKMAEAGLFYLGFGVESASERICREVINKPFALEHAYQVIAWCHEFGVRPNPFFIFGHPTETWAEAQETMRVIEELRDRAEISVALARIYPGTAWERRARAEGKLPPDFTWTRQDERVLTLPAIQGQAPVYLSDDLSWAQVCELLLRAASLQKRLSWPRRIWRVLSSLRSFADLRRYGVMFLIWAKKLWSRAPRASRADTCVGDS